MRLHVLSDVHLDFGPFTPPPTDADVVVLAGDVEMGSRGLPWIRAHFARRPVIYVLGNHEFYREATPALIDAMRAECRGANVHLLENEAVQIRGVTFLGCTLWTDFRLFGDPAIAGAFAAAAMNDYRLIRVSPHHRRLKGRDTARFHALSRRWLAEQLARLDPARTVLVTHHAPSPRSLDPMFSDDPLNAAYASNLETMIRASRVPLWIHGHIHRAADYIVGQTRVLANPRGYAGEESPGFQPGLVVEVESG
jgi:predicted phosphohydrolase